MKKYILLDWDGNLAKTLDMWLEACRVPLQKRGLNLSDAEIATCFGIPHERFAQWGITDIDAAISEMDAEAVRLLPEIDLYPDAVVVLEELQSAGLHLALITTSLRKNVVGLLDKYNLHHYFEVVVTGDDTEQHKPDPAPLELALKKLGGNKSEAIMIGDSDKDIGAATNAGVDSILFFPREHAKFYSLNHLQSFQPTHVVENFRDILQIVQNDDNVQLK